MKVKPIDPRVKYVFTLKLWKELQPVYFAVGKLEVKYEESLILYNF